MTHKGSEEKFNDRNTIKYRLVYSNRKSISIIVSPGRIVTVRAPHGSRAEAVNRFVLQKSAWIMKHLDKQDKLTMLNRGKSYTDGEKHLFRGIEMTLTLRPSQKVYVRQYDTTIEAGLPDPANSGAVKVLLGKWYRQRAVEIIPARMREILERFRSYGFAPSALTIRPLKSRWGSCTSRNRITISSELVKLDPVFTDYVIIHELCHLMHHNHGKDFYTLLRELVPDYTELRKELRRYLAV
jgi:predicted metal-dependent hydrolase